MTLAHLSFSTYDSYVRCGKALELAKLRRAPRLPAWWFVGGKLVHDMTEVYDRASFFGESVNMDQTEADTLTRLREMIDEEVEKSGVDPALWMAGGRQPNKQRFDWWAENAPLMVRRYVEWREATGWKILELDSIGGPLPAVEFKVSLFLGDTEIVGYIDRVFVTSTGEALVCDIKTGKSHAIEPLQLGLYALALEDMGLPRPSYGVFWKALKGEHTAPVPLEKFTRSFLEARFGQVLDGIQRGVFLPNVGSSCGTCGVKAACYAMDGPESHLYDPLDPNYTPEGG